MINAVFERYELFLFVLSRMTGFVIFSPVFGRRNIPAATRGAISFVLAIFALLAITSEPELDMAQSVETDNMIMFIILVIKEFVFGYLIGLIVNMFFSVVSISGEVIDMQMGLGMSKVYDPASNIQMPLIGNFYNIALMLVFFMTNSHIVLINLLISSFNISPVGVINFNPDIGIYLMRMFSDIFNLSLRLAFPVIAAELVSEVGIGVLMRAVPQINVFVVGLQLKILAGIIVMMICAPVSVVFFDNLFAGMNDSIYDAIRVFAQ